MNGNEKSLVSNALQMIPHLPHKQCECGVNAHKKCSLALVHHTKRSKEKKKKLMNGEDGREKNKTTLMMCRKRIETLSLYEMLIFAVVFFVVVVVVNAAAALALALAPAINVHSKLPLTMAFMQRQMVRNNLVKFVQMK